MRRFPTRAIVTRVAEKLLRPGSYSRGVFVFALIALVALGASSHAVARAAGPASAAAAPSLQAQPQNGSGLPQLPPCPNEPPDEGAALPPARPIRPAPASGSLSAPAVSLAASSDTGDSNSDRLTGNNMPTFEGQAPAGSTVTLFDNGVLTGLATADAQGKWSYMINECQALNDGTHAISAQARDAAGRVSSLSPDLSVTIVTRAPDMPVITAPRANEHAKGGTLVVSGTATAGTTIKILEGSATRGSTRADAHGTWSVRLRGLPAGPHTLRANATDAAGNESPAFNPVTVTVDSTGGAASAGAAGATAPSTESATSPASSATTTTVTALAAGDIACGTGSTGDCQQQATANILTANNPTVVLPLGDDQYECGLLGDFQNYYGPSWGALKPSTYPSIGNHEYYISTTANTPCYNAPPGAPGYFTYFGNAATPNQPGCTSGCGGYYSYDVGSWHIVVLNSVCSQVGGCGLGSPQETWLKNDLAAHPTQCTLAYWHYPRYTSGLSQTTFLNSLSAFWQDLYNAGTEVILNGHDHDYERFARMDPNGQLNTVWGIREFVVGTGGRSHQPFGAVTANSQVRNSTTYGTLQLTLNSGSYSWRFLPVAGQTFTDSGSESCH